MATGDSKISICNAVLIPMGIKPILNFSETNKRASTCNALYDQSRREVLGAHPWSFADTRKTLTKLAATPAFRMQSYWQLPLDYLKVNEMHAPDDARIKYRWRIEHYQGDAVLATDATESVACRYTRNVEDPKVFTPDFIKILKSLLESRFAIAFRGSQDIANRAYQKYQFELAELSAADVYEGDGSALTEPREDERVVDLILARFR